MRNPFEFGSELGPDDLVDRRSELRAIGNAIRDSAKLWLIGPRRFGKSSLLNSAAALARETGVVVLRYDAEAFPTVEQLAARISADTAARLTGSVEKGRKAIVHMFGSLRPEASIQPDGTLSVRLAGTSDRAAGVPLLTDVLDAVERAAVKSKRAVTIMIDEFQKIVSDDMAAKQQLRASVQKHRKVGYVFAGSATRLLADMTSNAHEPFYRLGSVLFLGPVPREEFATFLVQSFTRGSVRVEPGAVDAILEAAQEVPYNVQLLAHACWEACRSSLDPGSAKQPLPLTVALVGRVHATAARQNDPLYTQTWNSLTSPQQRALLAVVRDSGASLFSSRMAGRYSMPVSTMQKAIAALERRGITREEGDRGKVRLRLEDPLFGKWIEITIPSTPAD